MQEIFFQKFGSNKETYLLIGINSCLYSTRNNRALSSTKKSGVGTEKCRIKRQRHLHDQKDLLFQKSRLTLIHFLFFN